jgi:transketolase
MEKTTDVQQLQAIAKQIRRDIVEMLTAAGSGHPGGSLSAVEILVTLYFDVLRHDPANPKWPDRDRFILSKGHAAPVLYSVLAECGYTPKDQLKTLRKLGSIYQGHPDVRFLPVLEASTGSLGEGLSLGIGMALAAKLDHSPLDPLPEKWRAFKWHAIEVNGHDIPALQAAFREAAVTQGKPTAIIAHTIKGKGVSFMENNPKYHGVAPTAEEMEKALMELR